MLILYVVPISLWPMLGKEIWYFYTRHPKNNDRWLIYSLSFSLSLFFLSLSLYHISLCYRHHCVRCLCFISPFRKFYEELKELCVFVITVSLSLPFSLSYLMDVFVLVFYYYFKKIVLKLRSILG